jgi:hypothetical protein
MQRNRWWFELDTDSMEDVMDGIGWDLPGMKRYSILMPKLASRESQSASRRANVSIS